MAHAHDSVPQAPPFLDILLARIIRFLKKRTGLLRPFTVFPFKGYGWGDRVILSGRVIEQVRVHTAQDDDPWWRNAITMFQVFFRARAERATLRFTIGDHSYRVTTDAIGYFSSEISLPEKIEQLGWVDISFNLDPIPGYRRIAGSRGSFLNIPAAIRHVGTGIISDVDDTILESYATDLLMTARMTFLKNSATRSAIDGMASLYQAIVGLSDPFSPVFYVTSSSWSLYDLINDFLNLQGFPAGVLLMQKIGMANNKLIRRGHGHKTRKIEDILRFSGDVRFFLFGDNGQSDREIYFDIASRYPERIRAVCIRDARPKPKRFMADFRSINIPYLEFKDGVSLKRQLQNAGLIPS